MHSPSIDELDMTGLIPFSGLIIDILAIAALVKSFGQPLMWAVIFAWIVSSWAKNGMAEYVKQNGFDGNVKGPMFVAGAFQDVECVVALYILFWR